VFRTAERPLRFFVFQGGFVDKKGKISESLSRGLAILDLLGVEDAGYTLKEIADRVAISKTSAHRYVSMLCDQGYLERSTRSGLYRMGVRTLSLSLAIVENSELVRLVKPLVNEAAERHGLHIDVGILANDAIYLIYRRDSKDTQAFRSFSYSSALHYLAAGKAAMAFLEPDTLGDLVDRLDLVGKTSRTITDPQALLADLAQARQLGFARNNEESLPGLIAIGAPLFSLRTGAVVGAVSFDSSTASYSMKEFEDQFAGHLVELAKKLSAAVSL
jgi:DNA-binding IclR family transcriptional regulator